MNGSATTEKLRMLLAEAGYPNATIREYDDMGPAVDLTPGDPGSVPDLVVWRAFRLITESEGRSDHPCFDCWMMGYGDECADGDCRAAS